MNALVLSLVAFGALHAVPALPSLSCRLNKRFGRKTHLIAYSLISTTVMILALNAALASDYMELCPVVPRRGLADCADTHPLRWPRLLVFRRNVRGRCARPAKARCGVADHCLD